MRHTDLTNRTAFGLVQACLEAEVPLSVLLAQSVDDQRQRAGAIFPDAGAPLRHGGRARGRLRRHAGTPYTAVGRVSRRGVSWRAPRASPAAGAACGPPCPASRPLGALWRLSSVPQPPAWSDYSHATAARHRQGGDGHRVPSLDLGATAQACVCARYGALPLVSVGGAADYRGHHARGGHPEDPPASETFCRPTSH